MMLKSANQSATSTSTSNFELQPTGCILMQYQNQRCRRTKLPRKKKKKAKKLLDTCQKFLIEKNIPVGPQCKPDRIPRRVSRFCFEALQEKSHFGLTAQQNCFQTPTKTKNQGCFLIFLV
jgi:hypothetical protein